MCSACGVFAAQGGPTVRHPNLFLNAKEIAAARTRINRYTWARSLYKDLRERAEDVLRDGNGYTVLYGDNSPSAPHYVWTLGKRLRDLALMAAISNEPKYAQGVRVKLRAFVRTHEANPAALDAFVDAMGGINLCWAYDLTYGEYSAAERAEVEDLLLRWSNHVKPALEKTRPNGNIEFWGRAFLGTVGYTIGNPDFVRFAIERPTGLKQVLESGILDHALWHEAPCYGMGYVSSAMLVLAEAALHYDGTDLYRWKSTSGDSIRTFFDNWPNLAFPRDLRVTTYGDESSQSPVVSATEAIPRLIGDYFLINDRDGRDWNKYDIAYHRYKDPLYAWVLGHNPKRDEWDHALWGYSALIYGDPLPSKGPPPPARSVVFPESGLAMLRAQEGPSYWESKAPAVSVRFGPKANHSHNDAFHITVHGRGRLLEPDWFIQWDYLRRPENRNLTPWSKHPIAHNTVLVDRRNYPAIQKALDIREQDFADAVKMFRIAGDLYGGVAEQRTLALTREYLLDIFELSGNQEHSYDWVLHGLGTLRLSGLQLSPFDVGAAFGFGVIDAKFPEARNNRWIRNGVQANAPDAFSATWAQNDGAGVKVTMLAQEGTTVYSGDGPYYVSALGIMDQLPGGEVRSVPMIAVHRQGARTSYVALHEPFDASSQPELRIRRISSQHAIDVFEITGPRFTDYFFHVGNIGTVHDASFGVGSIRFSGGDAFVRVVAGRMEVQGRIESGGISASASIRSVTVNGRRQRHSVLVPIP